MQVMFISRALWPKAEGFALRRTQDVGDVSQANWYMVGEQATMHRNAFDVKRQLEDASGRRKINILRPYTEGELIVDVDTGELWEVCVIPVQAA